MRFGLGGLALAAVLTTTACSKPPAPPPAAPAGLSLPVTADGHGVMSAQTAKIKVKGKKGDYTADVAITPSWWAAQGEFKIVWYAGLSQVKRFFNISGETGDPGDRPSWLKDPETGVRQVQVSFDGGPLQAVKPDTARAPFKIPAGAKAVTEVKMDFGPADNPQTVDWK
jgi:hypothetical protein